MKFKFTIQDYQTDAVNAVIDCFKGQPTDQVTQQFESKADSQQAKGEQTTFEPSLIKNAALKLDKNEILQNIKDVQIREKLLQSQKLVHTESAQINLDVEMETGTGKTYCYTKTIFEMNQKFGWSKFIIVVPNIAIREGVHKSLKDTQDHFYQTYGKKAQFFIYDSKDPSPIRKFSSNKKINIMIINMQAFNTSVGATTENTRKIYTELDGFGSDTPMDKIKVTRPILILDEPQKMQANKTQAALAEFDPLFVLRYSATHKKKHNIVYRLSAKDAFDKKLVKKVAVCGVSVSGLAATDGYLYLQSIRTSSTRPPVARIDMEVQQKTKITRKVFNLQKGDNLYDKSNGLEEYRGILIGDIDATTQTVRLSNGDILERGQATKDFGEEHLRRTQIREAIRMHLQKEQELFKKRIKVLSLFFIDAVAKYRLYPEGKEANGEYATIFEEEYEHAIKEIMGDSLVSDGYKKYLNNITAEETHDGYFAKDKNQMIDSTERGTNPSDVKAYDLILKRKELLLSFDHPARFIFSHSALREGWDNPNIFVICILKHIDNNPKSTARRQEVGRGLRICVDENGDRQDDKETIHTTNVLTVVASESYEVFAKALQKDILGAEADRPRLANADYFKGKIMKTNEGAIPVTEAMAKDIVHYLIINGYAGRDEKITQEYLDAVEAGKRAPIFPEDYPDIEPYKKQIFDLIESVYADVDMPEIENERSTGENPLNKNFEKAEFQKLWQRINHRAAYTMHFDTPELVKKCIPEVNKVRVARFQSKVQYGEQTSEGFEMTKESSPENAPIATSFAGEYDLLDKIANGTDLTRETVFNILSGIEKAVFAQFKINPEMFITNVIKAIKDYSASNFIKHLRYDTVNETYDIDIFKDGQYRQNFTKATDKLNNHIYDYAIIDSKTEREFAARLDVHSAVSVYAKLPRGFTIPTPFESYNPDWAIAFKKGAVKHIYFVAETKDTDIPEERRVMENRKIECAKKFFEMINKKIAPKGVKYDVVTDIDHLLDIANR